MFRSNISYRTLAGCVAAVADSPKEFVRVVDQFDSQDFNQNEGAGASFSSLTSFKAS